MKKPPGDFSLIPRLQPCGSKAKQSGLLEAWLRYMVGGTEKPNQPVCSWIHSLPVSHFALSHQEPDHRGFVSVAIGWAWPLDMLVENWRARGGEVTVSLSLVAFLAVTF